jgi:hypothetical protein
MAVSILKPKHALLVVACALLPTILISACAGDAFQGLDDAAAGNGRAGSGDGGSGGSTTGQGGTGTAVACGGPEDCNDNDACTIDRCNADGSCDASAMCQGTQKCCEGECAQCCEDSDCDDGVSCTNSTCFAGQCMYIPDDSRCEPTQYCSIQDDCRAKQVCGLVDGEDIAAVCDDGSPCTSDTCEGNFCQHGFCNGSEEGALCCPDKGCAKQCCVDAQCDKDDDPCTVGACSDDGLCSLVQLCPGDQQCCPSADNETATCGACCSAEDCDDDVSCTDDKCAGGQCSSTPDDARCDDGYYCDPNPNRGCQKAPTCQNAAECVPPSPCQSNPRCADGRCEFDNCSLGTKCCQDGCAVCCGASECDDGIACTKDACTSSGCSHQPDDSLCPGQICDANLGGCIGCRDNGDCNDNSDCTIDVCNVENNSCVHTTACAKYQVCYEGKCSECAADSDCQGGVIASDAAQPNLAPGDCSVSKCVSGACQTSYVTCSGLETCCSPFGCAIHCVATK